jgi:hypothetical protein
MKNKSLRTYETVKLHYGKYLYKLKIYNQLASIFRTEFQRDGKLAYAKNQLQDYNSRMFNGQILRKGKWTTTIISNDDLQDANHIFTCLRYSKSYLIRCEHNSLMIYSNNLNFLSKIANGLKGDNVELWKPLKDNEQLLKNNKNILIVDKPVEYKYKITFGRYKAKPELGSWLTINTDKSRAGNTFIKNCIESGYINGQYIFVRDDKVLFLVHMLVGNNITKIEDKFS